MIAHRALATMSFLKLIASLWHSEHWIRLGCYIALKGYLVSVHNNVFTVSNWCLILPNAVLPLLLPPAVVENRAVRSLRIPYLWIKQNKLLIVDRLSLDTC